MKFFQDIGKVWAALIERILYILDPYKKNDEIEFLRMQLQVERNEKASILEMFILKPIEPEVDVGNNHQPVNPYIPWRVKRAQLEYEDRQKLKTLGDKPSQIQEDISKLEEELEIS